MRRELKWLRGYPGTRADQGVIDQARDELAKCAAGELDLAMAISALDDMSNWQSAVGCIAVLDGDKGGFANIDVACLYNFWAIRLMVLGYDLDQRANKQPRGLLMDRIATCWMHAEALGATSIRAWLDALVIRVHDGYGGVGGREMNALATLVAHYATGRDAEELERADWASIDVYRSVAAGAFAAREYDALATYHETGVDGDGYPPFHAYPYRIAPFELLAIARRTKVPIDGQHPLLATPLAHAREVPELAVPNELRGVIARAVAELSIEA
jgi:hypothetical protein